MDQTVHKAGIFSPKKIISEDLLNIFKGAFELFDFSPENVTDNKIFFSFLLDKKYKPEEIVHFAGELPVPYSLVQSVDILYCAIHPEKWDTSTFSEHKKNIVRIYSKTFITS